MTHVLLPHFDVPFRLWNDGGLTVPRVVEQDSTDDVVNCVEAAIRTQRGQRLDEPTFGIVEPTFQSLPLNTMDLIGQISTHEERASIVMTETPDRLDTLVDTLTTRVGLREETNANPA